jgi:hypothetical protein
MWALKVSRSMIAATSRRSGKTDPHSLNGRLVPIPMLARSSRSGDLAQQLGGAWVDLDVAELVEQQKIKPPVGPTTRDRCRSSAASTSSFTNCAVVT